MVDARSMLLLRDLLMPKSPSLIVPSRVRKMFWLLRSRWRIPRERERVKHYYKHVFTKEDTSRVDVLDGQEDLS